MFFLDWHEKLKNFRLISFDFYSLCFCHRCILCGNNVFGRYSFVFCLFLWFAKLTPDAHCRSGDCVFCYVNYCKSVDSLLFKCVTTRVVCCRVRNFWNNVMFWQEFFVCADANFFSLKSRHLDRSLRPFSSDYWCIGEKQKYHVSVQCPCLR